jgi:hypothetical protein
MNGTAAPIISLVVVGGIFYAIFSMIDSQDEKFERKEIEDKALFERFVIAVENLSIQKEPAK